MFMGLIGESLASQFKRFDRDASFQAQVKKLEKIGSKPSGVHDLKEIIEQGYDPLHAAYIVMQNHTSVFAEKISILGELKAYYDIAESAEDEYMPSAPPMSPLTSSYFTCWAFFDLQFGPDKETIGTCYLDLAEQAKFYPDSVHIMELMQNSRMGIYEHCGIQDGRVLLQDIVTQDEHLCYVPTGYSGKKGQCWYVRILPPINEYFDYSVVFNTPYILTGESKEDWLSFIKRARAGSADGDISYYDFMKYGLDINYWNEFVFMAYLNHQSDAIFLKGIPDVTESMPHGDLKRKEPSQPVRRDRSKVSRNKKRRK